MPNGFRFRKINRLLQSRFFKQIFKSEPIISRFFVIYCQKNSLEYSRLAIITSKRNVNLAVVRNRFKRIVRECFRHQAHVLSSDILVIARKQVNLASKQEIRKCLEKQFQRLKQY